MPDLDAVYRHALTQLPWMGPKRFQTLLRLYGSVQAAWHRLPEFASEHLSAKQQNDAAQLVKSFDPENAFKRLQRDGIQITYPGREDYPFLLAEIPDAPFLLYYRGSLPTRTPVTMVGTRQPSPYGKYVVESLLIELASFPLSLISGLAFGIDACSHIAALKNGMYTAAVLGSGLNRIRPVANNYLADKILAHGGALISEYPPEADSSNGSFPRRNRILAGLSKLTCVIEAAEKSGALITARFALDYNRDVAAVPGSIFSDMSKGCHALLRQGASVLERGEDILNQLLIPSQQPAGNVTDENLTVEERTVLQMLGSEPLTLDELRQEAELPSATLLSILTKLELLRLVRNQAGEGFMRLR